MPGRWVLPPRAGRVTCSPPAPLAPPPSPFYRFLLWASPCAEPKGDTSLHRADCAGRMGCGVPREGCVGNGRNVTVGAHGITEICPPCGGKDSQTDPGRGDGRLMLVRALGGVGGTRGKGAAPGLVPLVCRCGDQHACRGLPVVTGGSTGECCGQRTPWAGSRKEPDPLSRPLSLCPSRSQRHSRRGQAEPWALLMPFPVTLWLVSDVWLKATNGSRNCPHLTPGRAKHLRGPKMGGLCGTPCA